MKLLNKSGKRSCYKPFDDMLFRMKKIRLMPHWMHYVCLWCFFCIFVAFGITVSNLGVLHSDNLTDICGEKKLIGHYRSIRSDEYRAHGVLPSIQQYNASPRFPRHNPFVGLSGRNYLMLHDTGAPVAHITMLARPATWGFFVFDLRRALSWLSLFPIFFGIFSFWFFLDTFFQKTSWCHFLAALAVTFTTNSAVWSFWPIYNVAGTVLAVAAVLRLLQTQQKWAFLGWGSLTGWGISVSAMTLYYPRVWYGGLLAAAILIGGMFDQKLWNRLRSVRVWVGGLIAIAILATFMYAWYLGVTIDGTFDLMQNSVYPGQRRDYGGDMPLWTSFIGWLSPFTIFQRSEFFAKTGTHLCKIQEPMTLVFPLFVYIVFQWKQFSRKSVIAATMLCLLLLIGYCYIQYPVWFVKMLGFDRGNQWRIDYFVSLWQIFILVAFCHEPVGSVLLRICQKKIVKKMIYCGIILLSICLPPLILLQIPETMGKIFIGAHFTRILLYTFFFGGLYGLITLLIFHKIRLATTIFLLLEIVLGAFINPVCIAPTKLVSPLFSQIQKEAASWHYEGRVLICESGSEGNLYAAAGGKTLTGFYQYEDPQIFDIVLKNLPKANFCHRLHNLTVHIVNQSKPLSAMTWRMAGIDLFLNGKKYDFSQLPIDYVLIGCKDKNKCRFLMHNPSLQYIDKIRGFYRFRVLHSK